MYDCAPKFDIRWQITDWTALTDKATAIALNSIKSNESRSYAESAAPWL
jgi:hypothetical protein